MQSCDEGGAAAGKCLTCEEFLCADCLTAHKRVKITKDHEIEEFETEASQLESSKQSLLEMYCSKHPKEKLMYYCETCEKLNCR